MNNQISDNTEYYHTWYRNDKPTEFSISRNGTLRLPANEKSGGVYRCKINANSTAVLSEAITVDYPSKDYIFSIIFITKARFHCLSLQFHENSSTKSAQ